MRRALASHLYVRIWLAVVFAVALLTLLASWVVRLTTEPPLRDVVVRAESGVVIGEGKARLRPPDGLPEERKAVIPGMEHLPLGKFGPGPEFFVRLSDGELLHIHLPREPRTFWTRPPYGFLWSLSVVALAVARWWASEHQRTWRPTRTATLATTCGAFWPEALGPASGFAPAQEPPRRVFLQ